MASNQDPFLDIPWDPRSEQPPRIRQHRPLRTRFRLSWSEYLKSGAIAAALAPAIAARHWRFSRGKLPKGWKTRSDDVRDFMGLAIALHSCAPEKLAEEIRELGVRHLLLRIPVWEVNQLETYRRFLDLVPDCEVAVCVMQNRRNVLDLDLWRANLFEIVGACWPRVRAFQIGQGMNRSKWGCFSTAEYLRMASVAEELRPRFPQIELVGPGVLDFEPIAAIRGVRHGYPIHWDVVGAALYVDRRGSPRATQYKIFDFTHKIYNTVACAVGSSKAERRLWITEVNWPLQGFGRYAPTANRERVTVEDAGWYLREYYEDAWKTRLVERVYWWQLVAQGFGLIGFDDDGNLVRRPAYHAFRDLLHNGIHTATTTEQTPRHE